MRLLFLINAALSFLSYLLHLANGDGDWYSRAAVFLFCLAVVYIGGELEKINEELKKR